MEKTKKITILTAIPDFFDSFLNTSIIKRAIAKKLVEIKIINIRDFTLDKHHRIDSHPIGGGAGLILKCQPIVDALNDNSTLDSLKIITSPRGKTFTQKDAINISKNNDEIVILCGHYEGIDERVFKYFDIEYSIGDYILTGGEIPSLVIMDSVIRLIEGVISEDSIKEETFNSSLVEYPQYTLPYNFNNAYIPDILFSGNHEAIKKYNLKKSLEYTLKYRPDLLKNYEFNKEEKILLKELESNETPKREIDAIEKVSKEPLMYHSAFKKNSYIDEEGKEIIPEEPNSYKFESFIFDAFEFFDDIAILRGKREDDFAPVKNKDGVDSPKTAKELYEKYWERQ